MRFPYREIEPGKLGPIVPIRLFGGERPFLFDAFIDSGADFSIFDADAATAMGFDYRSGRKISITVGDGDRMTVYRHQLLVHFATRSFRAPICFSSDLGSGFNLLGRTGIFEKFRICFHEKHRFVAINSL